VSSRHIPQHTGLDRACRFQEVEVPRFPDIKVVRLSTLHTGHIYRPKKYSWYSRLLDAELTPGS